MPILYHERIEKMLTKLAAHNDKRVNDFYAMYVECYNPDAKLGIACRNPMYLKNKLTFIYNELCLINAYLNN